jgi:hypothetical protein
MVSKEYLEGWDEVSALIKSGWKSNGVFNPLTIQTHKNPDSVIEQLKNMSNCTHRGDAMMYACMECCTKHLGSALVLGQEMENGYPEHKVLVMGHLDQASAEIEAVYPEAAQQLRELRRTCYWEDRSPTFGEVCAIMSPIDPNFAGGEYVEEEYEEYEESEDDSEEIEYPVTREKGVLIFG